MPSDDLEATRAALRRLIGAEVGIKPKLTPRQIRAMGGRAGKGKPSHNPKGRPADPNSKTHKGRVRAYERERRRLAKQAGRVCDAKDCYALTDGRPMCGLHRYRQAHNGHWSVRRLPGREDIKRVVPTVHAFLKLHPIPAEVLEAVEKLLSPSADLTLKSRQGWRSKAYGEAKSKARAALLALRDQGRMKYHQRKDMKGKAYFRDAFGQAGAHAPTIAMVLLCLETWIDERNWGAGWGEHAARGKFLLQRVKWFGRKSRPRGQALRFVGQLVSEAIGVWLLVEAKKVTEFARTWTPKKRRRKKMASVPVGPVVPRHPGPEPQVNRLEDAQKHREWEGRMKRYQKYLDSLPSVGEEDIS